MDFKTAIAEAIYVLASAYINENNPIYKKKLKESINRLLYKYTDTIGRLASVMARQVYPNLNLTSITPAQRTKVPDLKFEHVIPLEVVAQNIFDAVTVAKNKTNAIKDIKNILEQTKVAWITKVEDSNLNAAGLKAKMPGDNPNDMSNPLARYKAVGITLI